MEKSKLIAPLLEKQITVISHQLELYLALQLPKLQMVVWFIN